MKPRILDTNVLIHGNGDSVQSPQTSAICFQKCIDVLFRITAGDYQIILDKNSTGSDVLTEYRNNLLYEGRGLGDAFFRWLLRNQYNEDIVISIPLNKLGENNYAEFPTHKDLKKFDPSDRKWIALANAYLATHNKSVPIIQSAEQNKKWHEFLKVFQELGIEVDFICE
jgi:hypothetical protein